MAIEWPLIIATALGPVLAVQAQKFVEKLDKKNQQKNWVFYTLMATRSARTTPEHVQALNTIDLVFTSKGKKNKSVVDAWALYRNCLFENTAQYDAAAKAVWNRRMDELFIDLLYAISEAVGYGFTKVQLKGVYSPQAQEDLVLAQYKIREGLVGLFSGTCAIPIEIKHTS